MNQKRLTNLTGWLVFAIATIVYFFSVERTGSLWDCGEFITGAYKLQVVHPPGAPIFLIVGRIFTFIADIFSDNPADIAFAVNLMSGLSSAFAAMFITWVTMILAKGALAGRHPELNNHQQIAVAAAGLVAGLSTAFASSVWFSAVEGEVYAMSTFFTAMTLWAAMKWYNLPESAHNDRWLIFAVFAASLSIGVHLLSLLTFPALAMFYYFKKFRKHTPVGILAAAGVGVLLIGITQALVITGLPRLWASMELFTVNFLGLPQHSGLIPMLLIVTAVLYFLIRYANKNRQPLAQILAVGGLMMVLGFSNIAVIVIRANANPPINMNQPSDAMRLLPYLNREQYGERPLFYGPWYGANPVDNKFEDRYGWVESSGQYEIVDYKVSYEYANRDKMLFPRMGDNTQNRSALYEQWRGGRTGKPTFFENIGFLVQYQLGWMYWRYFMWNFGGRQNADQGYYSWDPSSGNWLSGIKFLDEARLYNMDELPETMKKNEGRNRYFLLPFLFGLLGMIFHFRRHPSEALAILVLFVMTGIGIIIYSNQPPNEPRERDYVLVGSIFTYCIWIGMGVLAVFDLLYHKVKLDGRVSALTAALVVLSAPVIMGVQNYDDHSRRHHLASRDYAANFLNSCAENAIIFTYGDNDTYPLWYAQEVEGIRTDVRVVNLSLIAVDWYINQLRRRVNDSPAIKLTVPQEAIRGSSRNTVPYYNPQQGSDYNPNLDRVQNAMDVLRFIGTDQVKGSRDPRQPKSFLPTKRMYVAIDPQKAIELNMVNPADTTRQTFDRLPIRLPASKNYLIKDELAVLDVIASNINERPIYFAVTVRPEKMLNLQDFMRLEGLALRIVPTRANEQDRQDRRLYGGVYGAGYVGVDQVYENVMEDFRWGNFDKFDLFVDRSYAPSIQSFHVVMLRTAEQLYTRGDEERCVALCEKYLEAFPHMNFPYDYRTMRFLSLMAEAGAYDKAKPHMQILAEEMLDHLVFYNSLSPVDLEAGFQQEFMLAMRTKDELIQTAARAGDTEFESALRTMFADFDINRGPGD